MKRWIVTAVALATALVVVGCGGGGGSGNATEDALSFMPKDAPVVITLDTDPNGDQWKQVNELVGKFPFAGQVKSQLKQSFTQSAKLDFDKDVKPILGNQLVFSVPNVQALQQNNTPVFGALHVNDEGKANAFVKKDATKVGSVDGTDLYKETGDTFIAVKDGTILIGDTQQDIEAALKRHDGSDHMTQDDFDNLLAGVSADGLLTVGVNAQQAIANSPNSANARKVKWVNGLRGVGISIGAESDGLVVNVKANTEGVTDADLPFAAGSQSAPVVRRPSDVGFGIHDLAQFVTFSQSVAQVSNPSGYARFLKQKGQINKALGIDLDKDVIQQFQGDASISVGTDGGFAMRSDLKDPNAFRATLRKAAPKLTKLLKGQHVGVSVPKTPSGFYGLATANGKKYVFGAIGNKFVLATDAARAAQFATQSATAVPGAKGSLVMAADTRAIVNAVAQRQGQSAAVGIVTGALGDFTGSLETETSGMTGSFKLNIK